MKSHSAFQFQRVSQSNYHLLSYLNKTKYCRKRKYFQETVRIKNLHLSKELNKHHNKENFLGRLIEPLLYKIHIHPACIITVTYLLWFYLPQWIKLKTYVSTQSKLKFPSQRGKLLNNRDNVKELKLILVQTTCLISNRTPIYVFYD